MPTPGERIEAELDELVERGQSIVVREVEALEVAEETQRRALRERLPEGGPRTPADTYPGFAEEYQLWYTRARRAVAQLLPERVAEFEQHYRQSTSRHIDTRSSTTTYEKYSRQPLRDIDRQIYLLKAAGERLGDALADIRGVLEANLFDTELDAADELRRAKHVRAAGVVAGVVLERHLQDLAGAHGVKLRKSKPTLSDVNDALKTAGVYDVPTWRRIQHLGDIRNLSAHAKERDPDNDEIQELIRGVQSIVKTVF